MAEREILKLSRPRVKRPERVKVFEKAIEMVKMLPVIKPVRGGVSTITVLATGGGVDYDQMMEPIRLLRDHGLVIYPSHFSKLITLHNFLDGETDRVKDAWLSVLWRTHGDV